MDPVPAKNCSGGARYCSHVKSGIRIKSVKDGLKKISSLKFPRCEVWVCKLCRFFDGEPPIILFFAALPSVQPPCKYTKEKKFTRKCRMLYLFILLFSHLAVVTCGWNRYHYIVWACGAVCLDVFNLWGTILFLQNVPRWWWPHFPTFNVYFFGLIVVLRCFHVLLRIYRTVCLQEWKRQQALCCD